MVSIHSKHLAARAEILKALAHPTRLFLVDELARGERCVCELTELVGADISTVSRHLKLLRQSHILVAEKRGAQIWYSLRMPCVLTFFQCIDHIMTSSARQQADLIEEQID
ncbi:MAG: winged helix-turn-helix transcriptional regulator [Acidobacteria bacterium]|nr:winged helix-turn-helix transcriptional regulator [Acidobacteriota bacterium]